MEGTLRLETDQGFYQFTSATVLESQDSAELDFKIWEEELRRPIVAEIRDLSHENELRKKTQKMIGAIAVNSEMAHGQQELKQLTLKDAIDRAAEGDAEAYNMVAKNVAADRGERRYKDRYVTNTKLSVTQEGLVQYGQSMSDMHVNTLAHIKDSLIKNRGRIELLNAQRIEHYQSEGLLREGNVILVPSLMPNTVSIERVDDAGYFVDSATGCFQVFAEVDGEITLQSAFVAGVDPTESLAEVSKNRFDIAAFKRAMLRLGIDYGTADTEEILSRPLVIPRDLVPNLAVSVVELYDRAIEELHPGTSRFFGTAHTGYKPYETWAHFCAERDKAAQDEVMKVVEVLIAERARFTRPVDATKRLDELNHAMLEDAVVTDCSIDVRVLGRKSQQYIEQAREQYQNGNLLALQQLQHMIHLHAKSSSCPTGTTSIDEDLELLTGSSSALEKSDNNTDCEFMSKQCPKCKAKNVWTVCRNGVYTGSCGCSSK